MGSVALWLKYKGFHPNLTEHAGEVSFFLTTLCSYEAYLGFGGRDTVAIKSNTPTLVQIRE